MMQMDERYLRYLIYWRGANIITETSTKQIPAPIQSYKSNEFSLLLPLRVNAAYHVIYFSKLMIFIIVSYDKILKIFCIR